MRAEEIFQQTLREAQELYEARKHQFSENPLFKSLLKELEEGLKQSEEAYRKSGALLLCRKCASRHKCTCCGKDMELEVSRELLLLNLFLGVRLPSRRFHGQACYFLGEKGCMLKARPILCRNFFCPWFKENISLEHLRYLQNQQTKEIETLFKLLDYLKRQLFSIDFTF